DLFQLLWVIEFHYPPLLCRVVFIEDAETGGLLFVQALAATSLKCAGAFQPGLLVKIISVENERLTFGVEDPAIWFLRLSIPRDVIDLGNIKVPGAHQFADVPVIGE